MAGRVHSARWVLVAAVLAGGGIALAQSVGGVDVQAILNRAEAPNPDAEAMAKEVQRRSEEMREEAKGVAAGAAQNLETNRSRLGGGPAGPIDFDELVRTSGDLQADRGRAPQLIVFASLSMPPQSLKALIRDTARAGGTVVFNGFPGGSAKAFQQAILRVVDNDSDYGNIGIDPRLFRAFHVTAVPAVVVATSDFDLCDGFDCTTAVPPFDVISGNVTLGYALETFAEGKGPGAAIAAQTLKRLRSGGGL